MGKDERKKPKRIVKEVIRMNATLATTPILLKMTASETLQWFSVSFVMHFVLAIVMGVVVSCALGLVTAAKHKCINREL